MKKYIIAAALLVAFSNVQGQIDRSKAPISTETPEIKIGEASQFQLKNGLKVIVVENHKLPQVRVSLGLDLPPMLEGGKVGMAAFVGDILRAGTSTYTKEELDLKIDALGSDFWTTASGAGVSTLTKHLDESVSVLSEIVKNANFTNQKTLDKLKKQSITGLESEAKNPDAISSRVSSVLLFGKEHPYGEYATEETLSAIELTDLKKYYKQYFNASNGYLVIVGDIKEKEAKKLANKYFGDFVKGEKAKATFKNPVNVKQTEIDLIDLPSATQSLISITNLAPLKKTNTDYFAAKLANNILGNGGFAARLFQNLREKHGWTYGAYSSLSSNTDAIGTFSASAKVRNEVTDSAVVEFISEMNKITTENPSDEEVKSIKTRSTGIFALRLESPETTAGFILDQITDNLGDDFYKNYLKNLNEVSSEQIKKAAKEYIKPDNARIIIVGKAEEILPKLKKLGYPIHFYDRFGNSVKNPTIKKEAKNITAEMVIDNYLKAIGGKEKLQTIYSIKEIYDAEFAAIPAPLKVYDLKGMPNKFSTTVTIPSMNNALISKSVFDGIKGYEQSPQDKTAYDSKKLAELKKENSLFSQLNYKNAVLKGIVPLKNHDVYEIEINGNKEYYNVETYLLEREIRLEEEQGKPVYVTTDFSDYRDVEGIKMPYANELTIPDAPSTIKSTLSEIEFNVETSDLDFQ